MSNDARKIAKSVVNNKGLRNIIKAIALIFFIPTLLVGFIFVLISTIVTINDYKVIKDYSKITAKLEDKTECDEENLCKGIYHYTINGIDYKAAGNTKTNVLPATTTVYYNPSNPKENHILVNMSLFMVVGLILVVGGILAYIGILKFISYLLDNASLALDEIPQVNKN